MAWEGIRVLGEADLDGCAGLYASVFAAEPWNEPWTARRARERLAEILYAPSYVGLVCAIGGEPAGLAMGNFMRRAAGRGFLLHELCVKTERQGQGVGEWLLACLEDRLRGEGVGSVFLLTGRDAPARGFYEENGYGEVAGMVAMLKVL